PLLALNIVCFPDCLSPDVLTEILRGGADTVHLSGAIIAGGHTIVDEEPKYGLAVLGQVHPEEIWCNSGAKPGDLLYLTKPLGSGVMNLALRGELLAAPEASLLTTNMATLNQAAAAAAYGLKVSAATDITGFGLLGHLLELAVASGYDLEIEAQKVPILPGARQMAEMGIVPQGAYRNRSHVAAHCVGLEDLPLWLSDLLVDPQTSGGLLLALPAREAIALEAGFVRHQVEFSCIGRVIAGTQGKIYLK
ncbi:MAG: selenide, water dikinase SelD, partial [Symbiobacteriaceae bacterium]|nr:selenide, water dikinase SelD [Symbiobacteriaceae bacterium]